MGLVKRACKVWEGKGEEETSLRLIMASKEIDKMISQAEKKDVKNNGARNPTDHRPRRSRQRRSRQSRSRQSRR